MAYSDFMDVLGRLHKLTPAQRRAVAEVLAEPEAGKPVARDKPGKPKNHGKPIDDAERHEFMRYAHACLRGPLRKRSRIYNQAAREMGRSYDSVRCQIIEAIKEIKSPRVTRMEASQ